MRRADESEFDDGLAEPPAVERILGKFGAAGLLVREDGTVAIASAALLRAWPRLRGWVAAERDGLPVHHDLADAALLWDRNGRKSSDLYQGTPLERAMRWAATGRRHAALNLVENAFLDACAALGRRRARLRRLLVGVLSALLALLAVTTVTVVAQQRTVTRQRDEAVARRLAGQAAELRRSDPRTARRLAVAAARLAAVPETRSAVLAALGQVEEDVFTPPGHSPEGGAMALAPDGRTLVTADAGTARLWDLDTHRQTRSVPISVPAAEGVALSPDGSTVAVGYGDGRARLWDVRTGRALGTEFGEPDPRNTSPVQVEFSPRGGHVLISTSERLQLWSGGAAPRLALRRDGPPKTHAFSPDDRTIILAVTEEFEWWDIAAHRRLPVDGTPLAPADRPGNVAFSPDGRLFARTEDTGITVTELATGRRAAWLFTANEQPLVPVFSPDGAFLADGGRLWRPAAGAAVSGLLMRNRDMEAQCGPSRFGAGARTLRCVREGRAVVSTDVSAYTRAPVLPGAPTPAEAAFSRDGRMLATLEGDRVRVWDVRGRRPVTEMPTAAEAVPGSADERFAWSADGRRLAVVAADGAGIDVWEVPARRKTGSLTAPGRPGLRVRELEFAPDGGSLDTIGEEGSQNVLEYWRVSPAGLIRSQPLPSPSGPEQAATTFEGLGLVFAPDGRSVTVGRGAGTFAFPSGARSAPPGPGMGPVRAAAPDGRTLAAVDSGRDVAFWDARTQRRTALRLLGGTGQERTAIVSVAFSPDGRTVATGDDAGAVRLWDAASGAPIGGAFTGHSSSVLALAFAPEGRSLLAVDGSGVLTSSPS
nr:hypothetical protein GCM10010200_007930 [Actinomadura rugatobispora]